jgi:transposase InsO family protein
VGWRPIAKALKGVIPTRLVQETVSRFKSRDRRRHRRHLEHHAVRVTVLAKNAIWTQDGAHLGRSEDKACEGQVMKDRGTTEFLSMSVGPSANAGDVLVLLKSTKDHEGELPLVWQTDNAKQYLASEVQEYLKEERVVPLLSRVRCPSDNGASEIGIRELKEQSELGKGVELENNTEGALRLGLSAVQINRYRLRGSRGFQTAQHLSENMPSWYNLVDRERFYEETCNAIGEAVQDKKGRRARHAEREAIFNMLEKYKLIERTRGRKPQLVCEREIVL